MAQRGPARPTARIEEAIGFVGTFGVLFLGVTVFCEVTGRPALGWALTLLAAVVAIVLLDRWRVSVLRRHRDATGEVDGVGAVARRTAPGRSRVAVSAPVRRAPTTPDGHAHVGWDEVADRGRRPGRDARPTAVVRSPSVAPVAPAGRSGAAGRPADG
ncbi:hypothetical protein [Curtobacterium luteum]|uniref:hypothetical protein n=1 Tax=Curtobacterium luteum TaxID=33881 RepID=UPI000AB31F8B|nr:hypothetical protein [Curtobacterium luteum]